MPFTIITGGSFTSTGAAVNIPLPSSADYFTTTNYTQMGLTGTVCVRGEWYGSKFGVGASAANDGLRWRKAGSSAILIDKFSTSTASDGFTYYQTAPIVEAPNSSGYSSTAANPAVVTQTNTYSNGDMIRLATATGDLVLGGMQFQISSVSGSGYTLLGLPATAANGFTAVSAGVTRRISQYAAVEPQYMFITNISPGSVASPAIAGSIVSVSADPSNYYVVGMKVHFSVPASFGMKEIDQLTGTITALNVAATTNTAAYNMVVDIDSSAFTPFVFPASAASPTTALFATLSPAGASTKFNPITNTYTGYNFNLQPFHTGNFVPFMHLGAGANSPAGANNDIIEWMAYKFEN